MVFLTLFFLFHYVYDAKAMSPRKIEFIQYKTAGSTFSVQDDVSGLIASESTYLMKFQPDQIVTLQVKLDKTTLNPCLALNQEKVTDCVGITGDFANWGLREGEKAIIVPATQEPIYNDVYIIFKVPAFEKLKKTEYFGKIFAFTTGAGITSTLNVKITTKAISVKTLPIESKNFNFFAKFGSQHISIQGKSSRSS